MLAGATVAVFAYIYQFRLFDISMSPPYAWAAIVVLDDLAYYWFHRFSHECRFWWAAHVNHHSSSGIQLVYCDPATVDRRARRHLGPVVRVAVDRFSARDDLPAERSQFAPTSSGSTPKPSSCMPAWFEYLFNAPSNHRVHHASNPRYVDRNYAGIFMVWDRLFGTFAAEPDDDKNRSTG